MEYDPVKDKLQSILGSSVTARKLFFAALDRFFLRSRYVRREITRLRADGFSPGEILDAGSGFGQYSFRLAKTFPRVKIVGLDLKEELVNSGNQFAVKAGFNQITFELGDLLSMTYKSRFNLVLSVDVMEHIEDDQSVLDNIGRALKPGGYFIMTTPYFNSSGRETAAIGQPFVDEHVRPGYFKSELQEKLSRAGMDLRQFTITYGPRGNIAWKLLQKWPLSWLSGRIWLAPLVALYFCLAYPIARIFMHMDMQTDNESGGGILAVAVKR